MWWLNRTHQWTLCWGIMSLLSASAVITPMFLSDIPDDHNLLLITGVADAILLLWAALSNLLRYRFCQHIVFYVLGVVPFSTAIAYIVRMGGYVHPTSIIAFGTIIVIALVWIAVITVQCYWSRLPAERRHAKMIEFNSGVPEE